MFTRTIIATVSAVVLVLSIAHADEEHERHSGEKRGKPLKPVTVNAKFQQECSTCHIAYAPGLLPAASWQKLMSGLDKHFGTDASLDNKDKEEISQYLVANASNRWNGSSAPLRISETSWFVREHDEISRATWSNPKVKSPANCGACHAKADQANFNEHDVRIPR